MQLSDFLSPVKESVFDSIKESSPGSLVNVLDIHVKKIPDIENIHLAIIGVKEDRFQEDHAGAMMTPDEIRKHFYKLVKPKPEIKIADLGNIEPGKNISDTLFALKSCVQYLLERKIITIILGGTQDLAYSQFAAYEGLNPNLNLICVDAKIDLKANESSPEDSPYLFKTISHQPNYLFNIVHMGNQNYFVEQESLDSFEKMNFDMLRLGNMRNNTQESEPLLRNADMMMMSMNAIRASDSPASIEANPNGLYGEEACQVARYSGMSNEISSIGFYDLNTTKDVDGRSAKLLSQMLWYFIQGFYNRKNDYPNADSKDYMIYRTSFVKNDYEIVFYKNIFTERWWMEVPYPKEKSRHKGKFLVPCSYSDYEAALKDEIPDRWMKAYHKLF
ncbi:MAG: formimidoylglutamase [Bacteroidia bacterium]